MIYDSGMKAFPAGLPQQPIFYPVLQLEYARQIASDWNIKNGDFAGYVTKFAVDDQYVKQFEEHRVGEFAYQELWIPADKLEEFNKHIVGHIKTVAAYFGDAFQGFVPDKFGLQGKNAIEQFTLLANTFIYKRMDFYLEVRRNHKAIYLNYPFWQKNDSKNPGLKEKLLKAIKEAWLTSFPNTPLVDFVQEERPLEIEPDQTLGEEFDQEDDAPSAQVEAEPSEDSVQDAVILGEEADPDLEEVQPIQWITARTPKHPDQEDEKSVKPVEPKPAFDSERFTPRVPPASLAKPAFQATKPEKPTVSHFEQGVQLGLNGKYREAIIELTRSVEGNPSHAVVYTSLGVAYHRVGEDDRAISCYDSALKIDPRYAEAHYFRANILYGRGDVRDAIAGYTVAIGLKPELIEAHQQNPVQDRLTDYTAPPSAIHWVARSARHILELNTLLKDNSQKVDLLKERAVEYSKLQNYEQAVADYSAALALQPKDATVLFSRGVAYEQMGQKDRALRDYQRAVEIDPQVADAYINRGIMFANIGNYRQAITSLSDGIRLAPKNPDVYFNRGVSYFQNGDLLNAIEDFSQVTRLSPEDEEAYYWRGISYDGLGREQDAVADYRKFLELSQNPQAREDVEQRLRQWDLKQQNEMSSQSAVSTDRESPRQAEREKRVRNPGLYELLNVLGERAFHSMWLGSGIECYGEAAEELSSLTDQMLINGQDIFRIASGIRQMTAGDLVAFDRGSDSHWILIRAWEGRGFYVEIEDPASAKKLRASFQSVEDIEGAVPPYDALFIHV
ncbi:MAG: tetratricopeptide repeat protein [Anaerolineales bacterium]